MKKYLVYFFMGSLLHHGLLLPMSNLATIQQGAVQKKEQFLRLWHCASEPQHYQCSFPEISRARQWIGGTSLAVLAVILATIGIKTRSNKIKQLKEKYQTGTEIFDVQTAIDAKRAEIQAVERSAAPAYAKFIKLQSLNAELEALSAK